MPIIISEDKKPFVSIIIPAYNASKYIQKTIESVLLQKADGFTFELICVDDGSKDNTFEILKKFENENFNFTAITQPNSGSPSRPRNIGIEKSRGEYIFFLDADDELLPGALQRYWDACNEQKMDIVLGKFIGKKGRPVPSQIFTKTTYNADLLDDYAWHNLSPTAKLCSRDLIISNELRFYEDQWIGEDQIFFAELYFLSERIGIISDQNFVAIDLLDDGSNLTSRKQTLRDKTKTAVRLGEVILKYTIPGKARDLLASRIFRLTLAPAMRDIFPEHTVYERHKFVKEIYSKIGVLYHDSHKLNLPVNLRPVFDLLVNGFSDDLDVWVDNKIVPTYIYEDNKLKLDVSSLTRKAREVVDRNLPSTGLSESTLNYIGRNDAESFKTSGFISVSGVAFEPSAIYLKLLERSDFRTVEVLGNIISSRKIENNVTRYEVEFNLPSDINLSRGAFGTFYKIVWDSGDFMEDRWGKKTPEISTDKIWFTNKTHECIAYFNKGYQNLTIDVDGAVHSKEVYESEKKKITQN